MSKSPTRLIVFMFLLGFWAQASSQEGICAKRCAELAARRAKTKLPLSPLEVQVAEACSSRTSSGVLVDVRINADSMVAGVLFDVNKEPSLDWEKSAAIAEQDSLRACLVSSNQTPQSPPSVKPDVSVENLFKEAKK